MKVTVGSASLADIMQMIGSEGDGPPEGPKLLNEAVIHRLLERAEHYGKACRFKKGDLVTPYEDTPLMVAGDPHLVLETFPFTQAPLHIGEPGTVTHGGHYDMRVMSLYQGRAIAAHWVESWYFTEWVDGDGQEGDADAGGGVVQAPAGGEAAVLEGRAEGGEG